ncbi:MAG: S1 RNA-binding domain-containing protein [Acidimicrobiales bacterium]
MRGRIDRYVAFGAFVDLDRQFLGLIENPNFSSDRRRDDQLAPEVGSDVQAVVLQFDDRNRQVRLSIRPEDVAAAGGGGR